MIPVESLVFALITFVSFSLASASIEAIQAACIPFKWLAIMSLIVFSSNAGGLSMRTDGKWGFLPNSN